MGVSKPFERVGGWVLTGVEVTVLAFVRVVEGVEERVGTRGVGVPGGREGVTAGLKVGALVDDSKVLGEKEADRVNCTGVPVVVKVDKGWEGVGKEVGVTSSTVTEARGEIVATNGVAVGKGEGEIVDTTVVPMGVLEVEGERVGKVEEEGLEEGVNNGLNDRGPE